MAFDRQSGWIVLLAAGETWSFDVCTNTWARTDPGQEPAAPLELVYDIDSATTIGVGRETGVWAHDLEANTWTRKGPAPRDGTFRVLYDPASGLVVAQAIGTKPAEIWTYRVETDTWTQLPQRGAPDLGSTADHELLAYDASKHRVVAYLTTGCVGCMGRETTWLFDPRTGSWSTASAVTPNVNTGYFASGGEIAYDEATAQTVVFSDGLVIAYEASADRWETVNGTARCCGYGATNRLGHWMAYDPVNRRLVVYGGSVRTATGWVEADDVLAFDPATGAWSQLLAPGTPYPRPTG
jgi:hypothetical protein